MKYGITLGAAIIGAGLAGCAPTDDEGTFSNAACHIDYASTKAIEIVEIKTGLSIYTRFVLEELSEDDLNEEEIVSLDRMQAILDSRARPVDRQDLAILDGAQIKLSDPSVWNRADDRKCGQRDESFSLYCALYLSSVDTLGEYQHRRTVIQEVRFAIEDATGGREFEHRLMDFNNLPETSFDDINVVIQTARDRVQERLELQAKCAL